MKWASLILAGILLFAVHQVHGEDAVADTWIKEAELPAGFPAPGPYGEIVKKEYPAYRAARTDTSGANRGFWTLFRHIKKNEIAMTTPVEMTMKDTDDGELEMAQMAFLYEDPKMGNAGPDGSKVEVVDLPTMKVLSIAWRGPRNDGTINEYKKKLLEESKKQGLKGDVFRVLGYNSPSVPRSKRTHELQLIIE